MTHLTHEKLRQKMSNAFDIVNEAIRRVKDQMLRGEEITQSSLERVLRDMEDEEKQ